LQSARTVLELGITVEFTEKAGRFSWSMPVFKSYASSIIFLPSSSWQLCRGLARHIIMVILDAI
jgi:hypothetical protein